MQINTLAFFNGLGANFQHLGLKYWYSAIFSILCEIVEFPWKCEKWSHSPKLNILVPEYHKKPSNLEFLKLILPIISFQVNLWINGNVYCIYVNTARFYETLYLGPYWLILALNIKKQLIVDFL